MSDIPEFQSTSSSQGRRVRKRFAESGIENETQPPENLSESPPEGRVGERISLLQGLGGRGTVDQPTSSRPSYVNLRSGPKLIVPRPATSRRSSQRSLASYLIRGQSDSDKETGGELVQDQEVTSQWRESVISEEVESEDRQSSQTPSPESLLKGFFGPASPSRLNAEPRLSFELTNQRSILSISPRKVSVTSPLKSTPPVQLSVPLPVVVATSTVPVPMASRTRCKYPHFKGKKGDAEGFIEDFEAVAAANGEDAPDLMAKIFGGVMRGDARTWHSGLVNKADWAVIKAEFLKAFQEEGSTSRAFTRLSFVVMKKGELLNSYLQKINKLAKKVTPAPPPSMIKEWFIQVLYPKLNSFGR